MTVFGAFLIGSLLGAATIIIAVFGKGHISTMIIMGTIAGLLIGFLIGIG